MNKQAWTNHFDHSRSTPLKKRWKEGGVGGGRFTKIVTKVT